MKGLLFVLFLFFPLVSALSISEVELNPEGSDSGNEWIEFFSEVQINNSEYKVSNNDGEDLILNLSFQGYYVYYFEKQWLDNSDEKIFLYKNNILIDSTPLLEDIKDNNFSFSKCDAWEFLGSSENLENNCKQEEILQEPPKIQETSETNLEETEELIKSTKITQTKEIPPNSKEIPKKLIENSSETIFLNPQIIKTNETNFNLENKWFVKYSLGIFSIFILILFVLKRKKPKNEWRN